MDTTVVVPSPSPVAPVAAEAAAGELLVLDSTVVILPPPLLVLLSLGPAAVGSSAGASRPSSTVEPRGRPPLAIASSSSRGTMLVPRDGHEDVPPFILEGVEGEEMEAKEWHLAEAVADRVL